MTFHDFKCAVSWENLIKCMYVKIVEIFLPGLLRWQIKHLILLQSVLALSLRNCVCICVFHKSNVGIKSLAAFITSV